MANALATEFGKEPAFNIHSSAFVVTCQVQRYSFIVHVTHLASTFTSKLVPDSHCWVGLDTLL